MKTTRPRRKPRKSAGHEPTPKPGWLHAWTEPLGTGDERSGAMSLEVLCKLVDEINEEGER